MLRSIAFITVMLIGTLREAHAQSAPRRVETRGAVVVGGEIASRRYPATRPYLPAGGYGIGGGGGVRATYFGRTVIDDETPRDLQPFLQRVSTYSFELHGSTFDRMLPIAARMEDPGPPAATRYQILRDTSIDLRAGVDQYIGRVSAIWGSIGLRDATRTITPSNLLLSWNRFLTVPLSLGFGLRFGTTRIDVGYRVEPGSAVGFPVTVPFWFGGIASLTTVVRSMVRLSVGGEVIVGGARAWSAVSIFPVPALGVTIGADFARGLVPSLEPRVNDRVGGNVGVSYWFDATVSVGAAYSAAWTDASIPQLDHLVSATVGARLH